MVSTENNWGDHEGLLTKAEEARSGDLRLLL